jgi:dTDP-4-amino-4,6-dideoxygalactose transaminase
MQIPLVNLDAQYRSIQPDIDAALQRVLDNSSFILGNEVTLFEKAFGNYIGTAGVVGVASGTAALHLALVACGVGLGDEVITTAHTFFATSEAISHAGAKPVFGDIDPTTFNLDANSVERAITSRTKAIVPVHLYGQTADLDPLFEIARRHNLWLIEDAAQAHGAEYQGRRCGSIGHLGCFSFYPGKNLGAYGDAGAVTGNDEELLSRVRKLRDHGRSSKYEHDEVGFAERLDALQAAVLAAKLPHLEEWTEARRRHAQMYDELLKDSPVVTPAEAHGSRHVYHLYVVRTPQRNDLIAHLKSRGISAGIHYPVPLHRQPAYQNSGYAQTALPETERASQEVLSLPMYPELTDKEIHYVVENIREFFE